MAVDPPSPDAAAHVWALIQAFVDEHSPRHRLRERLGTDLGRGRLKLKALLQLDGGPCSLGDIAEVQRIDPPNVTAIVDQLESLGLAARAPDPVDRRRKVVTLTPAGRRAAAVAREVIAEPPAPLAGLTPGELAQLAALLGRLVR